ncbi:MAG TPA: hypothetical protein VF054_11035 [Micromonosporaceae bacterium]
MGVVREAPAAHGVPAAHRLTLSAAELAVLVGLGDVRLPPGFAADTALDEDQRWDATATLARRGVLRRADDVADWTPVPSVAANLDVLVRPQVTIEVAVSVGDRGARAMYAVRGELGASLFALADAAAELSMFPAVSLGRELIRALPPDDQLAAGHQRINRVLGTDVAAQPAARSGRLPLAALSSYRGAGQHDGVADPALSGLDAARRELVDRLYRDTIGAMRALVTGATADGVALGQVIWLATVSGWVGLSPEPGPAGAPDVVLRSVERTEIGAWVAPYVARILEGAGR